MNHTNRVSGILALAITVAGVTACDKKASAQAAPSATQATDTACTFKHPDPKFCFSPPAGYEAKPVEKLPDATRLAFVSKDPSGAARLTIEWRSPLLPASFPKCQNVRDNAQPGEKIEDDGQGGCWQDSIKERGFGSGEKTKYHYINVHKKGPNGWLSCMSNGPPDADVPGVLAACQSIRFD